ncbi:MAG: tRNA (guanosine(46)-N7)-methyltransferase TrmB [Synergistaceae bacterium]|jgi:tRNA (guanine-N7-)-methyltransferase|nr:tRNA (guanosine(46)-N7)-methyltransferase TrmB [Synergistaceae bacterium]
MHWNFRDILHGPNEPRFEASDGPLVVEIGFGNGEYLEHLATTRPGSTVIGIEISQWCLAKGARRVLAGGFKNVRLMLGDARYLLKYAFDCCCISEVFMNFPCPWPKRRHSERRVNRSEFAELVNSRLAADGTFTLTTDVDWYAEETRTVFSVKSFETGPVVRIQPREYQTKYERKWLEMGRDIYEVCAKKNEFTLDSSHIQSEEQKTVESMESTDIFDAEKFRELVESLEDDSLDSQNPDYRVVFREIFFGTDMSALIKVISIDEGFEQHYHLKLVQTKDKLRAKIDSVGHPYKTPGVRASLRHVMRKAGGEHVRVTAL